MVVLAIGVAQHGCILPLSAGPFFPSYHLRSVIAFDLQAMVCFGHDVLITLLRLFYCVALKKHLPSGTPERRFMKGALPPDL